MTAVVVILLSVQEVCEFSVKWDGMQVQGTGLSSPDALWIILITCINYMQHIIGLQWNLQIKDMGPAILWTFVCYREAVKMFTTGALKIVRLCPLPLY